MNQLSLISPPVPLKVAASCPLNHGVATLDHLLAELTGGADAAAFDAALDLRWSLTNTEDATAIIQQFFLLRTLVEERHYLGCYRLRRWLEAQLVGLVSTHRQHAPQRVALRLDAGDLSELQTSCLLALEAAHTPWAQVRFAFSPESVTV